MSVIHKILVALGLRKEYQWTPPPPPFDEVYTYLLGNRPEELVVFDVGSHHGESIERFRALFPGCVVHSFEPDSDNFEIIKKKFGDDPKVVLNNCGIGDEPGQLTFHRYAKSDVSSFVEIDPESVWTRIRSAQSQTDPKHFETKAYEVPVDTLDHYAESKGITHIDLLKMDTQGFENKALMGAQQLLAKRGVDYVELELIVKSPYKKSLLFRDIENLLIPHDYQMYGIGKGSSYFKTSILQFDLLYAREGCYQEGPYKNDLR